VSACWGDAQVWSVYPVSGRFSTHRERQRRTSRTAFAFRSSRASPHLNPHTSKTKGQGDANGTSGVEASERGKRRSDPRREWFDYRWLN